MFTPKYTINNKILANIGQIEAAREVIENAPLVPAWQARFQEEALKRTIHFGTHLEGNRLNFSEAERVLEGEKIVARERDIQEVINYRQVMHFIEKIGKKKAPYKKKDLKEIHRLVVARVLTTKQAGNYRKREVVVKDSTNGQVVFRPPKAIEVPYQLDDFFAWLNSKEGREIHPILRSGITHFELVRIHPFMDGNGRAARALALLILFKEGYDVKRFFSLEEHFDQEAASYYQALQSVKVSGGDLTGWLAYFTQVLAIELSRIKEKVKKLSVDQHLRKRMGKQVALSERELKLVEYLQENQQLTMIEAKKVIPEYSEDTILRDLRDLMKKGIVKKRGKTKGAVYAIR